MTPLFKPRKAAPISRRPSPTYFRGGQPGQFNSPFQRKKPAGKSHWLAKTLDWGLLGMIVVILIYSLIVNPTPKVKANDFSYHPANAYALVAKAKLGSLSNRNKVTLNEKAVINAVTQQFPEVSSANLELPILSQTPVLHLNISPPSLYLNNHGTNYIVDSDGKAVAKASAYPAIKSLPQLIDTSDFPASVGKQVLSSSEISFINTLLSQCKHAGVNIKSLSLPQTAQEVDITTTDQSYFVKFYLGGDALTQTGQLLAARHQFATSHTQPSQYLDVRVSGKVFYK